MADWGNHTIRKVTPVGTNWVVTTLAGRAGNPGFVGGSPGQFDYPNGVAVDTNGNVYVADTGNAPIRKVTPACGDDPVTRTFSRSYRRGGGQLMATSMWRTITVTQSGN